MIVYFSREQSRCEVALKLRQQAFGAMLIEPESAVAQLVLHAEGQVGGTYTHRHVGLLLLRLGNDGVPLLATNQIIVFHQFVFLGIVTEWYEKHGCDGQGGVYAEVGYQQALQYLFSSIL